MTAAAITIKKSPEDKRQYRGIVLDNNVRALLVSDTGTDKSAAAAAVHVGSLRDPREWQGLAHFCEHMLFLGTEKYPGEDEYAKFISEHGGSNNAYTTGDHTCYHFDIAPPHLAATMDRFGQFFVSPLFTESATEREVNAVHSEYTKNIPQDVWRLQQLEHSLANPEHDYCKFNTGSLSTLFPEASVAPELRRQLLRFHSTHYSANRIGLAILGQESLDELEAMVRQSFGQVVDKQLAENHWEKHPYVGSQCGVKVLVVPNKDIRSVKIVCPLPDYRQFYRSSPDRYVSHLVGHEGLGSALAYLKKRGWSNSLSAGAAGGGPGFDSFRISLDLTEDGLQHVDEAVSVVFEYIDMLRRQPPLERIFNEERDLESMSFRFKDKENPSNLTRQCSSRLLYYDMEDVLTARMLLENFMPEKVTEILELLRPELCKIFVSSQSFAEVCDSEEPHYGTRYKVVPLDAKQLLALSHNEAAAKELRLPEPNPFISTDFAIKEREAAEGDQQQQQQHQQQQHQPPRVVADKDGCRLWFRQDTEYLLPKCCYTVELQSPLANSEPLAAVSGQLYLALLQDALNSLTYDAELAGLNCEISPSGLGALLAFNGFSEKLPVLLRSVAERIRKPDVDEIRFQSVYDYYERNLKNFKLEQPYRHCLFNLSLICKDVVWTHEERLAALKDVTLASVLEFGQQLQSRLHAEMLIFGNATAGDAQSQAQQLLQIIGCQPLPASQIRRSRDAILPSGCAMLHRCYIQLHKSSACTIYYQLEPQTSIAGKLRQQVLIKLLAQVLRERFFDQMRTKEQLGYLVTAQELPGVNTEGLVLIVQSERHPVFVESRIDNFIDAALPQLLENMSDKEFSSHVEALDSLITEKPKKLTARNKLLFDEISSGTHCFNRHARMSSLLTESVTKAELQQFCLKWIDKNSPHRRRLALHCTSVPTFGSNDENEYANYQGEEVKDVAQFKRLLSLGPLPPSTFLDQKHQQQQEEARHAAKL